MVIALNRFLHDHPRTVDAVLAALLLAAAIPGSTVTMPGRSSPVSWWPGVLLAGVACVGLMWRRIHPRPVTALAIICVTVMAGLGYTITALLLGPVMLALYTLALRTNRATVNPFAFSAVVLLIVTIIVGRAGEPLDMAILGPAVWLLVPTTLGTVLRMRGEMAERLRAEEARHHVREERVRIARDLHDVVAHHLALANAQAGVVAYLMRSRPEQAEKIVVELADSTSSALRELKAAVGLLRQSEESEAPVEPSPGLGRLDDLVGSLHAAGFTVTVVTEGEPRALSAGVDLIAYRIMQEALTNVTKYATAPAADVRLAYSRGRLRITVTNEAADSPEHEEGRVGGYGLIGMRERARSVGGSLRTGRGPEGRFEVAAELPAGSHTGGRGVFEDIDPAPGRPSAVRRGTLRMFK
ncbi:sensor histidine kinase [Streptomyces sp. NPDC057690]|uniref:sensor histidine kinase n=1 Tax=Streptomyces sp. NPDC057690 TaxID=3346214 RepID=UPI00369145CE